MEQDNIGELLAEQLDRLFTDTVNRELIVSVEEGEPATNLWSELENLGVLSALASEEHDGVALNWSDIEPVVRAAGRHGVPVPFVETLIANWLLSQAGIAPPSGAIAIATEIFALNADDKISGEGLAGWLEQAEHIVLVAQRDDDHFVCLVEPANSNSEKLDTIAREPMAKISLSNATAKSVAAAPSSLDALGILPHLAVLRTVQSAGALEQLLELCIEYGNTREQFGRPIGKFQAIQHAIAELAAETAATQVAGLFACNQIDQSQASYGAMIAKTRVGKAATRGSEIAHQVFGAIGFTDEHSLHYFTRRLWQWRSEAGSDLWWAEQLGHRAIKQGGDALWANITTN